jgi:hypothetical protein
MAGSGSVGGLQACRAVCQSLASAWPGHFRQLPEGMGELHEQVIVRCAPVGFAERVLQPEAAVLLNIVAFLARAVGERNIADPAGVQQEVAAAVADMLLGHPFSASRTG